MDDDNNMYWEDHEQLDDMIWSMGLDEDAMEVEIMDWLEEEEWLAAWLDLQDRLCFELEHGDVVTSWMKTTWQWRR